MRGNNEENKNMAFACISLLTVSCPPPDPCSNSGGRAWATSACINSLAYILSPNKQEVYIYDLSNSKTLSKQTTGHNPSGIASSPLGNQIYVTNYGDDTISVFQARDFQTYTLQSNIITGVGPSGIATNVRWNELYVAYEGASKVCVFDTSMENYGEAPTLKYTIPITSPDKKSAPRKIAINPNGDRLYVTDKDRIYTIVRNTDGTFKYPVSSESFGEDCLLQGIVVDGNDMVYVADSDIDEIIVFDSKSNKLSARIALKNSSESMHVNPVNIAITADETKMFVTGKDTNSIYVIDLKSRSLINTIPLTTKDENNAYGPVGIAMATDSYGGETFFVTNSSGKNLSIINTVIETFSDQILKNTSINPLANSPALTEIIIPCSIRFNAVTKPIL